MKRPDSLNIAHDEKHLKNYTHFHPKQKFLNEF